MTPHAEEREAALEHAGDEVERLLGELRAMVVAPAWERVERLVQALVGLYGAGLGRMVDHARAAGVLDGALADRMARDELVASLLALHGLHPLDARERIRRALTSLPASLAVELVALDDGRARLRVDGAAPAGLGAALERLIGDVAPEVTSVEIEGLAAPAPLVQIDLVRSRARKVT